MNTELTDRQIESIANIEGMDDPLACCISFARAIIEQDRAQRQAGQEPVARIEGIDEYGPRLQWTTHWIDVGVDAKLYTAPQPAPVQVAGEARLPVVATMVISADDDCWLERRSDDATPDGTFNLVIAADTQTALAAKDAEIARLQSDLARPESMAVGLMRAEIAALTKRSSAYKALSENLEHRISLYTQQGELVQEVIKTLASERQTNALLTAEIAALTSMQADYLMAARIAEGHLPVECPPLVMPLAGLLYTQARTLTAERDALKQDAGRLDYLVSQERQVWEVNGRYWVRHVTEAHDITAEHFTAAEAVDAAIAQATPQQKE